ncbi:hypothetical protein SDC9_149107 [bioreactor metagenome]|uniref:Uncharacterized protein n=1 Tax=bioreactor metagenome TaxID=1076179 RepID=A0A645EMK8_9ZZZZ
MEAAGRRARRDQHPRGRPGGLRPDGAAADRPGRVDVSGRQLRAACAAGTAPASGTRHRPDHRGHPETEGASALGLALPRRGGPRSRTAPVGDDLARRDPRSRPGAQHRDCCRRRVRGPARGASGAVRDGTPDPAASPRRATVRHGSGAAHPRGAPSARGTRRDRGDRPDSRLPGDVRSQDSGRSGQ